MSHLKSTYKKTNFTLNSPTHRLASIWQCPDVPDHIQLKRLIKFVTSTDTRGIGAILETKHDIY